MEITYKTVTGETWKDLEKLFESRGGPHSCWCMVWRVQMRSSDSPIKVQRKAGMKKLVDEKIPIGILAYDGAEPVGWCSIAPKSTYRTLGGNSELQNVWSLVCFFIKREYRGQGLTELLIEEAEKYASDQGAEYIEAYPVERDSPSYRFMGNREKFEKEGYQFTGMAGTRRNVMLKKINKK